MIPLNKSSQLEFSMSIRNSTEKLDRANFIIEGAGYDISLPITLSEDKALVKVPVLENVLLSGKHNIRMEVVLGGAVYVPFKDVLEFFAPPSIQVESKDIVQVVEDKEPVIFVASAIEPTVVEETQEEIQPEPTESEKRKAEFVKLMEEAFKTIKK